jgi:hypothetical protein
MYGLACPRLMFWGPLRMRMGLNHYDELSQPVTPSSSPWRIGGMTFSSSATVCIGSNNYVFSRYSAEMVFQFRAFLELGILVSFGSWDSGSLSRRVLIPGISSAISSAECDLNVYTLNVRLTIPAAGTDTWHSWSCLGCFADWSRRFGTGGTCLSRLCQVRPRL